jgi:hypothetical protein
MLQALSKVKDKIKHLFNPNAPVKNFDSKIKRDENKNHSNYTHRD